MKKLYFICLILILFLISVGLWLSTPKPPKYGELLRAREWKLLQIKKVGVADTLLNFTLVSVEPVKPYIGVENGDRVLLVYPEDLTNRMYWFKELEIDVTKNLTVQYSLYGSGTLYPTFLKKEENNFYSGKYTFFLTYVRPTECEQGELRRCKALVNLSKSLALLNELREIDYFPVRGIHTFYFTLLESPQARIEKIARISEIKILSNEVLLLEEDFE
jgi:hypothetical protein